MEGGKEQNYWPGFVDALSNVVLTLVFVLVVFVFALAMASNKVEKKMQEVVQAEKAQKTQQTTDSQQVAQLQQQLTDATSEIQKLREQVAKDASELQKVGSEQNDIANQNNDKHIAIDSKDPAKAHQGAIQVRQTNGVISLGYPLQIAEMDEKSATELGHVLDATEKNTGRHRVILKSTVGKEVYSAARRLAYYRAIEVRNMLISKNHEDPTNITMQLIVPSKPEDGHVEIIFQKQ